MTVTWTDVVVALAMIAAVVAIIWLVRQWWQRANFALASQRRCYRERVGGIDLHQNDVIGCTIGSTWETTIAPAFARNTSAPVAVLERANHHCAVPPLQSTGWPVSSVIGPNVSVVLLPCVNVSAWLIYRRIGHAEKLRPCTPPPNSTSSWSRCARATGRGIGVGPSTAQVARTCF